MPDAPFFGPLPEKNLDLDATLRYVQQNVNTFYRHLTLTDITMNNLKVADGSAAAPSISRTATADGLFFASGVLGVAISGAEVGRFTANGLRGVEVQSDTEPNSRTYTNTGYLDLDALTGGAGSITAVAVTADTGTRVLIGYSVQLTNAGGSCLVSYRISGATTVASDDAYSVFVITGGNAPVGRTRVHTGLTPGSNSFELQAKVTAGTGTILRADLWVIPL